MASPVVAGAAAVLLAYMPTLTPEEVIESLVNTANKSNVDAHISSDASAKFDNISRAGGVIDLKKAAEYAYNKFYKNNNTTTPVKASAPKMNKRKVKK
jgi:subtilisin family serine protease